MTLGVGINGYSEAASSAHFTRRGISLRRNKKREIFKCDYLLLLFFCGGEPETFLFTSPRALKSGKFASFFFLRRARSHHVVGVTAAFPPHARVHFARLAHAEIAFCLERARNIKGVRVGSNFSKQPHFRRLLPGAAVSPAGGGARNAPGAAAAAPAQPPPPPPPAAPRQTIVVFVRLRKSVRALLMSSSRGCAAK